MSVDFLSFQDLVNDWTKGIIADDAYHDRRIGLSEGSGRPFNELGEVIDVAGFDLILRSCFVVLRPAI